MRQEPSPYYGFFDRIGAVLRCALGGAVILGAGAEIFDNVHVGAYAYAGAFLGGAIGIATRAWRFFPR